MHVDPSNPDCLIDIAPEHSTSISNDSPFAFATLHSHRARILLRIGFGIVISPASKIESRW
jgi:hypothetical protein